MGAYLSEPNINKESMDGDNGHLSFGASSMQGWRIDQEDAHNSILNFDEKTAFFAVFDGHGGAEVAQYCSKYLPDYLKKLDDYKIGNLEDALKNLFLKFDESLLTPEAQKELKELREMTSRKSSVKDVDEKKEDLAESGNSDNDEEPEYESEAAQLYDEATMPIEEVLKRYSKTEKKMKKALKKKGVLRASSSVEEKPASFQEQEERDIKEIKKNSTNIENSENGSHDNEYDEASNLGEVSDSQKSNVICESSSLQSGENSMSKSILSNSLDTNAKSKMSKDEIKLSPIRKKPSTSLLIDDVSSIASETTILNCTTNQSLSNYEENKENDMAGGSSGNQETEANLDAKKDNSEIKNIEHNSQIEKENVSKTNKKLSNTNLIAKLIAGVVNSKLKQNLKKIKRTNGKKMDEAKDDKENDGDADDEEGGEQQDDYEDNDEDEEQEESDEDNDEDDDDDDEESDDDDDYEEDEEDDNEEEDDDDEDDDGGIDIDAAQGLGMESRPGYDSGCTAVVALLRETKLYVANAGDSRCVVCREGKAIEMSIDHKPEDDLERERIEKAGGTVTKDGRVNSGLNLSRAIGDHSYKGNKNLSLSEQMITSLPDLKLLDIDITKDKFMVLACDGIWNFMSSQEVCDYIQERLDANYAKLSQICEEMFMHCLAPDSDGDGTGCDNMTCIIVTFNPFRKVCVKLNKEEINNEKACLKRSHDENEEKEQSTSQSSETDNKKLKQELTDHN